MGTDSAFDPASGSNQNLGRAGRSDNLAMDVDWAIRSDVTIDHQISGKETTSGIRVGGFRPVRDLVIQGHMRTFCPLADRPDWNRDETGRQPYERRSAKKRILPCAEIPTGSTQVLITVIKRSTLSNKDWRANDQR